MRFKNKRIVVFTWPTIIIIIIIYLFIIYFIIYTMYIIYYIPIKINWLSTTVIEDNNN